MLTFLLLACLQEPPPSLSLAGPHLLTERTTELVLELRAEAAVEDAELRAWLPPDLRASGLEGPVSLKAGEAQHRSFHLEVEAGRPAAAFSIKIELIGKDGQPLASLTRQHRTALGEELLHMPFESRAGIPKSDGDLELSLQADSVACGHRALRLRLEAGKKGKLTFWTAEDGSPVLADFAHAGLYLRGSGDAKLQLLLEGNGKSQRHDLSSELEAASPVEGKAGWRYLALELDKILDADGASAVLSRMEILVEAGETDAEFDLDELLIGRGTTRPALKELRDLTQQYSGSRPKEAGQIEAMAIRLAAIDASDLSDPESVDHSLLDQALQLAAAELELPEKARGKPATAARFAALLRHRHHLDLTPEEVRALGVEQVKHHQELLARQAQEVAPGRSWREVVEILKERHSSAEELPAFAEMAMQEAIDFSLEKGFLRVPRAARTARILVVTDGRRSRTYPFGGYGGARPSPDGFTGTYFVSPPAVWMNEAESRDRLRGNHRAWTRVVALHEIVPGHHLQTVIHRMRPFSDFRRSFYSTVFAEGWALYCEEMMFEAGFFPDADTRFTQLHMRLWRAARMVIDASIHGGGMSLQEAEEYLVEQVAFDPINANAEVLRYVDNPSRPMSYMLGYILITELIRNAREASGAAFEIADFRDRLLSFGPIPIPAIRIGLGL